MRSASKTFVTAATAVAVSFGGAIANADTVSAEEAATVSNEHAPRGAFLDGLNKLQAVGHFGTDGFGTIPKTQEAAAFVGGSISDLGMTVDQAYYATQAIWGILWTVLALVGLGGIYNAAKAAGLLR